MELIRTDAEVKELLDAVQEQAEQGGTKFMSMTFEEGLSEAIHWLTEPDYGHPYFFDSLR